MCVFLISPVPIAETLTSELIDTPVFHNLAPRPIKYRVSVPIPTPGIDCPYGADIFTPSLFFFNLDICVKKLCMHISMPILCIVYATFINEIPGVNGNVSLIYLSFN